MPSCRTVLFFDGSSGFGATEADEKVVGFWVTPFSATIMISFTFSGVKSLNTMT